MIDHEFVGLGDACRWWICGEHNSSSHACGLPRSAHPPAPAQAPAATDEIEALIAERWERCEWQEVAQSPAMHAEVIRRLAAALSAQREAVADMTNQRDQAIVQAGHALAQWNETGLRLEQAEAKLAAAERDALERAARSGASRRFR